MNSRFFPRYNISDSRFDLFFLGKNLSALPDITNIVDVSLSGIKIHLKNLDPQFTGAKVCIKMANQTLYFQTRLIWSQSLNQDEFVVGLKLIIPTVETFQKWLALIEQLDVNFVKERDKRNERTLQTMKDSTAHHASLY